MLADVPYNLVIKFFVIYRWLLTITCDESVIPDQCGFWFWLFVILSQIYYRRYIILVFESSWTFFRGESVIADQCGFWFWFFVILLKDIGFTLFLYLNRVGTFFRGESVITDQCGFWFRFFVILLKYISVTLFLYLNRVGHFSEIGIPCYISWFGADF